MIFILLHAVRPPLWPSTLSNPESVCRVHLRRPRVPLCTGGLFCGRWFNGVGQVVCLLVGPLSSLFITERGGLVSAAINVERPISVFNLSISGPCC